MITIDDRALGWFEREFDAQKPYTIRLYPQYAGFGEKNKGYSLAFSIEEPANPSIQQEQNGVTFFVETNDQWFFDDTDVELKLCEKSNEICARYKEIQH